MTVLLIFFAMAAMAFSLRERAKNKTLRGELAYIGDRLGDKPYRQGDAYLLIPTENAQVKELAAQLNRLLEALYAQRADGQRAKRAMEQLFADISHDLRTPLTVLKGYSELLMQEGGRADGAQLQDMIGRIDRKADELVRTIDAYFTMAKIESGDSKAQPRRTDLVAVCHDVILDYYDTLEKEHFTVDIQIGSEPVFAYADPEALRRILKNLLDNAITHGGGGRYLALRMRQEDRVCIEIEDHGAGIAIKDRERIFTRAYTTAHSGSGLGLAIAKSLAQQMDADLTADSEPGVKTVFTLRLPEA